MKLILSLIAAALMTGCAFDSKVLIPERIVTKYKYVVTTVPDEFLEVPAQVPNLDTKTATDADAAKWILDKEERSQNMETKLRSIKDNQGKKLQDLKTDLKIPKEDIIVK